MGELPVCALPDIRVTGSDFLKNEKATGTLYITNKRLVFIAETGLVRKRMEAVFDFPLMYLKSVEEDGRFRRRLVLRMKQGDLRISCSDQTMRVLPDYVEMARKFDKYIQTDMQRVRQLEQNETNISDVRLKIEELVYSLLSTSTRGYDDTTGRAPMDSYRRAPWTDPPQGRIPYDAGYARREEFRDRLEGSFGRPHYDWRDYPDAAAGGNLEVLRRDAESINQAVRETVRLLRDGRLVAEDFIRRYKDLMRDSYYNRKEIERLSRNTRDRYW